MEASRTLPAVLVLGAALRNQARLFNCALVVHGCRLLGVIPKTYLPNYREFYETRQFTSASQAVSDTIVVADQRAPFGNDLIFTSDACPDFKLHVEICQCFEDLHEAIVQTVPQMKFGIAFCESDGPAPHVGTATTRAFYRWRKGTRFRSAAVTGSAIGAIAP